MKKLMLIFTAVFCLTHMVNAQEKAPVKKDKKGAPAKAIQVAVKMENGKVFDLREGKHEQVLTEVNISGTVVYAEGSLVFQDGHKDALGDGDCVLPDGSIFREGDHSFREPEKK